MINELYDIALEYVKKHNLNNYFKEIRFVNEKNTILNKTIQYVIKNIDIKSKNSNFLI